MQILNKFSILSFCLIMSLYTEANYAQTIQQQKVVGGAYWRITRSVSTSKINKKLFGQPNSGVQVTFEDKTVNKKILIKFQTDESWSRIVYGDYEKWLKDFGGYGWGDNQFIKPTAINFISYTINGSQRNELFVLDKLAGKVVVLKVNFDFSGPGGSGNTNVEFVRNIEGFGLSEDIATYTINSVPYMVICETGNHRLLFYDLSTGNYTYRNSYGAIGSGVGQFKYPNSFDISSSAFTGQSIFVDDKSNHRIVKLIPTRNSDGTVSVTWNSTMSHNYDISSFSTDDFGNLFITDKSSNCLYKFDHNFQYLLDYGSYGVGQNPNQMDHPRNFSTGCYLYKSYSGVYSFWKNDVSFLTETWSDETGGALYDLGTNMAGMNIAIPSNTTNMAGTQISYFLTDWSRYYVTIDRLVNGAWQNVRWWGIPVNNFLTEVTYPGVNSVIWDGKDYNANLLPRNPYRFSVEVKEAYNDTSNPTNKKLTYIYETPLTASLEGPQNVIQCDPGTWTAVVSGGGGPYTYQWKKDGVLIGTASYVSTTVCGGFILTLTVTSGSQTSTQSMSISPTGGGCPFVFTQKSFGAEPDNNILHYSEFNENVGKDINDHYKLNVKPEKLNNKYKLQIKEMNDDHSYFDQFSLKAIDHSADTEIGVTENNDVIGYKKADIVTADLLTYENKETVYHQGEAASGEKNDVMHIHFSTEKASSLQKSLSNKSSSNQYLALLIDFNKTYRNLPPGKGGGGEVKAVKGENGGLNKPISSNKILNTKINFGWRQQGSVVLIPFTNDTQLDDIVINWTRDYEIQSIGLVPVSNIETEQELSLKSAMHSKLGELKTNAKKLDKKYLELVIGETIDLTFDAGLDPQEGLTRDFVFKTAGHYFIPGQSEYSATHTIPVIYELSQNYPNPFNPETTINYNLPEDAVVVLKVYNVLGQEVRTLVNKKESAGFKSFFWDGKNDFGQQVSSGLYIYRLVAGNFTKSKKMLLLK